MRHLKSVRIFLLFLLGLLGGSVSSSYAQDEPKNAPGGFFDRQELDQGFFPEFNPTPSSANGEEQVNIRPGLKGQNYDSPQVDTPQQRQGFFSDFNDSIDPSSVSEKHRDTAEQNSNSVQSEQSRGFFPEINVTSSYTKSDARQESLDSIRRRLTGEGAGPDRVTFQSIKQSALGEGQPSGQPDFVIESRSVGRNVVDRTSFLNQEGIRKLIEPLLSAKDGGDVPILNLLFRGTPTAHFERIIFALKRAQGLFYIGKVAVLGMKSMENVYNLEDAREFFSRQAVKLTPILRKHEMESVLPTILQVINGQLDRIIPPEVAIFKKFKLAPEHDKEETRNDILRLISVLQLEYSPLWIVQYRGKVFLFEGEFDPTELLPTIQEYRPMPKSVSRDEKSGMLIEEEEVGNNKVITAAYKRDGLPLLPPGRVYDQLREYLAVFHGGSIPVGTPSTLKFLDHCAKPVIRKKDVGPILSSIQRSLFRSPMDYLIYGDENEATRQKISEMKAKGVVTVRYRNGADLATEVNKNPHLSFIKTVPLRCLPSRYFYVVEGDRIVQQIREGQAIWTQ